MHTSTNFPSRRIVAIQTHRSCSIVESMSSEGHLEACSDSGTANSVRVLLSFASKQRALAKDIRGAVNGEALATCSLSGPEVAIKAFREAVAKATLLEHQAELNESTARRLARSVSVG